MSEIFNKTQRNILAADDDPHLLDLYRLILEGQGYQASLATDGGTALRLYNQALAAGSPFDAVIMDMGMPGLDGLECARRVLQIHPQAQIIIATGDMDCDLQDLSDRVASVLIKPISLRALLQGVASCLGSGSQAPAFSGRA